MTIHQLGLTPQQVLERRKGMGGHDANITMSGDPEAIFRNWLVKTGQAEEEDLSDVLPVQIGNVTEDFNLSWLSKKTGLPVTRRREHVISQTHPFMRCNLDGVMVDCPRPIPAGASAYVDAKHVNQYSKIDAVAQKYMPQVHHNGHVIGVEWAILSVLIGTLNYEWVAIKLDPFYTQTLIEAEEYFWRCVETMTPPGEIKVDVAPALPTTMRVVNMEGSNEFGWHAQGWLSNRDAAKKFKDSEIKLKELVEADVSEAFGHGISIRRSKSGALTIREQKS